MKQLKTSHPFKFSKVILTYLFLITITFIYTDIYLSKNNQSLLTFNELPTITEEQPHEDINPNYELVQTYIDKYHNKEVTGIIKISNTNYEKAIMQHKNNEYYLNHLENKKSHYMGSIYLDFRLDINTAKKLLIYGHNSKNVSMPFKILENYYNFDYYQEHQYIEIITPEKTRTYQIFSIYVETNDFDYMQTDYDNTTTWYNHITKLKNKSLYDTNINITPQDNILILQTCSTHKNYQTSPKKYLLIIAKEII